jgi:large subunit ribosomal protein L35
MASRRQETTVRDQLPQARSRARRLLWRRMNQMPKIKSHKGASKRFETTGSGKLVRVKAWRGHHLDIKSSRRTRRYEGKAVVSKTSEEQVRRMLPYL